MPVYQSISQASVLWRAPNSTGNVTVTLPKPSGTVDGDLLVAFLTTGSDLGQTSAPSAPPGGWSGVIGSYSYNGTSGTGIAAYYKTASSEPSSYDWIWAVTGNPVQATGGCMVRISGQKLAAITDGSNGASSSSGTSLSFSQSITTTVANDLIVMIVAGQSGVTFSPDIFNFAVANSNPTWTNRVVAAGMNGGGTQYHQLSLATAPYSVAGATGTATATSLNSLSTPQSYIVAITRNNIFSSTVSDTETVTESLSVMRKRVASVSDTETVTESASASKSRQWSNQSKNTSSWTDQAKN